MSEQALGGIPPGFVIVTENKFLGFVAVLFSLRFALHTSQQLVLSVGE